MAVTQPHVVDHLVLTVPDIQRAVDFYRTAFGFQVLLGPIVVRADEQNELSQMMTDFFGPKFQEAEVAYLGSANGVGLELIRFLEPNTILPDSSFSYNVVGPTHFAVLDPDIEFFVRRVVAAGGKKRSGVHSWDAKHPYRTVHLEDPFGNVIQCSSHPFLQVHASRAEGQLKAP